MSSDKLVIAIVGLDYAGILAAATFARKFHVIAFDMDEERIGRLKNRLEGKEDIKVPGIPAEDIRFTCDPEMLHQANLIILTASASGDIAPADGKPVLSAHSKLTGSFMKRGAVVVYEETVYPGWIEEKGIPLLEGFSGLEAGREFFVGYSPGRLSREDRKHPSAGIRRVVSGQTGDVSEFIASVYQSVIDAEIFRAPSIRVAEAAKAMENTQRDVNIALMNELAILCNHMDIDTGDVLETAGTKRDFLKFAPSLVSGQTDCTFFVQKSERIPDIPGVMLAGRRTNEGMSEYIARTLIKKLSARSLPLRGVTVTVLGVTAKEDVPDLRHSKVINLIRELREYGMTVQVSDASMETGMAILNEELTLMEEQDLLPASVVILAVPHAAYKKAGWTKIEQLLDERGGIVLDVKCALDKLKKPPKVELWRL